MSIRRDTILNIGGSIIPMILSLGIIPLYLGFIGVERYGTMAVIWSLLSYFSFFDLGFGSAITQRMSSQEDKSDKNLSDLLWTALVSTFFLGSVAGLLLQASASFVFENFVHLSQSNYAEASSAIFWLFPALSILLPITVLQGALQAKFRFASVNSIQIFGNTLGQVLPLCAAALGYISLNVLVPIALLPRVLVMLLLFWQCRTHVPIRGLPLLDKRHFIALINYGKWASLVTVLAPILTTIDRLIIASFSGAKAVTYYAVPFDLVSRTMIISKGLSSAIFPRLAQSDSKTSFDLAARTSVILIDLLSPIVIFGIFIVGPFLKLWLGAEFSQYSKGIGELILLGVWFNALVVPFHARSMAANSPKFVVLIYLFEIPIYLLLLWAGLKIYGLPGAAGAWAIRVLIDSILLLRLNSALFICIKNVRISLLLVLTSECLTLFYNNDYIPYLGIPILLCSLYLGRNSIQQIFPPSFFRNLLKTND
ncbi:oligosaccharide flippase family protein [Hydrogenophaga sp.]|uniref:oligosaccharide flippase family protein n=1 Tax=Hydrogenophaga sp. TaxID=1904254 RepID=UPI0027339476|nr:oligosaccharide flippase family protein [Hydrogenophaga sp.]MDP3884871.1 oligosaccharide flippase family protein [Hydrogenophaga sp.]